MFVQPKHVALSIIIIIIIINCYVWKSYLFVAYCMDTEGMVHVVKHFLYVIFLCFFAQFVVHYTSMTSAKWMSQGSNTAVSICRPAESHAVSEDTPSALTPYLISDFFPAAYISLWFLVPVPS